jgi:hypothetical protein
MLPIIFPVSVEDMNDGRYRAAVRAELPGMYQLELQYDGVAVGGFPMVVEVVSNNEGGGRSSLEKEGAVRPLLQGVDDAATGGHRCLLKHCLGAEGMGHGWWAGDEWVLQRCRMAPVTHERANRCLQGRRILFVGDSLLRCQFWELVTWLSQRQKFVLGEPVQMGGLEMGIKKPNEKGLRYGNCTSYAQDAPCEQQHNHFDGYDQRYAEYFPSIDTTVLFKAGWNSIFEPNYPKVQQREYYTGEAARRMAPWFGFGEEIERWSNGGGAEGVEKGQGKEKAFPRRAEGEVLGRGDVLVMNAASHDMIADDVDAYRANLHESLHQIRDKWGYGGLIIWVTASAPVSEKQGKNFPHYKWLQTPVKTVQYNRVAKEVMGEWGVPVIDAFGLSSPRPELSYDGQHYVSHANILSEPVYAALREALLTEITSSMCVAMGCTDRN